MKTYVKTIEAIQFINDNKEELKEFIGEQGDLFDLEGKLTLVTKTEKWNVVEGDYIVKDFKEVLVYKASRFEVEFDLVSITETPPEPITSETFKEEIPSKEEKSTRTKKVTKE